MEKRRLVLEFEEERPGRWTSRKQICGFRPHFSWKSKEALEEDLAAFFRLRQGGTDLKALAARYAENKAPEPASNLGEKPPIFFADFVLGRFREIREGMDGWSREEQRLNRIIGIRKRVWAGQPDLDPAPFASKLLHEITSDEIVSWFREFDRKYESINTQHHMKAAVRAVFRVAVFKEERYILTDPSIDLKLPTIPEPNRVGRSPEEVNRLLTFSDSSVRAHVLLGAYCGLGTTEQARLRVEHVCGRWLKLKGRGKKRMARQMWLRDEVCDAIEAFMARPPGAFLLPWSKGTAASFTNVRRAFNGARIRAGLDRWSHYDLRHTFSEWLRDANVRHDVAEYLMGHKLPPNTYGGITTKMKMDAIMRLPALPDARILATKVATADHLGPPKSQMAVRA